MVNSLKILLTEIIDYAGLFPPSKVGMPTAVQNYANYLKSENAWMLGRFILPVGSLNEFSKEADKFLPKKNPWRLSVIADENLPKTISKIAAFNQKHEGRAVIDTVEMKVTTADEIKKASDIIPKDLIAYFEIPLQDIMTDLMIALAMTKNRAKIRTGGITQDAFPNSGEIVKFLRICIAANVPFKATAGLHHPLKCVKRLTYVENAPVGMMHGFLNVFLAACYLRQEINNSFVHRLTNDQEISNFEFADEGVLWQEHSISTGVISATRAKNAISFGSCSFLEPIEDLISLNILN